MYTNTFDIGIHSDHGYLATLEQPPGTTLRAKPSLYELDVWKLNIENIGLKIETGLFYVPTMNEHV